MARLTKAELISLVSSVACFLVAVGFGFTSSNATDNITKIDDNKNGDCMASFFIGIAPDFSDWKKMTDFWTLNGQDKGNARTQ